MLSLCLFIKKKQKMVAKQKKKNLQFTTHN